MGIKGKPLMSHLGQKPSYSKAEAVEAHSIVLLCELLVNKLDAYKVELNDESVEFAEATKIVIKNCEKMLERAYGIEQVRSSTYFQELTHKFDTFMRKNYQFIG